MAPLPRPALGLLLFVPGLAAAGPIEEFTENVERGGRYEPGDLTLRTDPALGRADVERLARRLGCQWDHQWGRRNYHTLRCDPERDMAKLIETFAAAKGVEWVEAGFYDEEEAVPNDLFELQWYHRNTGQAVDMISGTPGADLGSVDAWEVSTGSDQRVIAILDIGLYTQHLDLATQVWTNAGENCTNRIDDDNNGYVDDCHGWDIGEQDNDASPLTLPPQQPDGDPCLRWHGTYIAGLAAAQGDNNLGLAGTAWDASLMNLKRHRDSSCGGTSTRSAEATFYAIDNGADVLGYSFNSSTRSTVFQEALTAADVAGVIAVMSAGNGGANIDGATRYPNNYTMTHKIVTGASNNRDRLDPASNHGASRVDIASPGTYVVSTAIEDPQAYGVGTGTSMAVGFGLGAVALAKAAYPTAGPTQVLQAVLQGGRAVPALSCATSPRCVRTGRRLDLLGMMQQLAPLRPASLSLSAVRFTELAAADGAAGPGERVLVAFSVTNGGPGVAPGLRASARVLGGGVTAQNPSLPVGTVQAGQNFAPAAYLPALVVDAACATDFDARVELTVEDVLGHAAQATLTVPVRCAGAPPPPDAGPAMDAGTPAPDGGAPPPDAGWVRDSGVHRDAGLVVRDSGVHRDGGAAPTAPVGPDARGEASGCRAGPGAWPGALFALVALVALRRRRRG